MSDPQLRLIVYRESVGRPRLRWPPEGAKEGNPPPERAEAGEWSEEVYRWELGGGEQVVPALSTRLTQEFAEGLIPARRRVARLGDVAAEMRRSVDGEWSVSMEPQLSSEEKLAPSMVNASAALVEHLQWIANTFANLPGAHIVVR